jgi:hypothetical protein
MADPGIWCGGKGGVDNFCAAGTQVCCVQSDPFGVPTSRSCEANGIAPCGLGLAIKCDDHTDCPAGYVCCGALANDGYKSVTCQKTSCASLPGLQGVRFCDPSAATDECATMGAACQPSGRLPGYSVCQ